MKFTEIYLQAPYECRKWIINIMYTEENISVVLSPGYLNNLIASSGYSSHANLYGRNSVRLDEFEDGDTVQLLSKEGMICNLKIKIDAATGSITIGKNKEEVI